MKKITVDVSDSDYSKFLLLLKNSDVWCEKVKASEVIGGFIADLIASDFSHGSDERNLARSYFDRCYSF